MKKMWKIVFCIGLFISAILVFLMYSNSINKKNSNNLDYLLNNETCLNVLTIEEINSVCSNEFNGELYDSTYVSYENEEIDKDYGVIEDCRTVYQEIIEYPYTLKTFGIDISNYESQERVNSIWSRVKEGIYKMDNQKLIEELIIDENKAIYSESDVLWEVEDEITDAGDTKGIVFISKNTIIEIDNTIQTSGELICTKEQLISLGELVSKKIKKM